MAREKIGYRDNLALITERISETFPNSMGVLTTQQVATFLGCDVKTVLRNIQRRYNPLPARDIGNGRKVYRIAITELARWTLGG